MTTERTELGHLVDTLHSIYAQIQKWDDAEKRRIDKCEPGDDVMLSLHTRRSMFYTVLKSMLYMLLGFIRTQARSASLPLEYVKSAEVIDTKVNHRRPTPVSHQR